MSAQEQAERLARARNTARLRRHEHIVAIHDIVTHAHRDRDARRFPDYTAPERLRGTEGLPAGDLFSAGVTLYQAIKGVSPFRRGRHLDGGAEGRAAHPSPS